jgi:hypothetical protein
MERLHDTSWVDRGPVRTAMPRRLCGVPQPGTQVEFMIEPQTIEALQALAPAIGLVQARRPA